MDAELLPPLLIIRRIAVLSRCDVPLAAGMLRMIYRWRARYERSATHRRPARPLLV